MGPSSSRVVPLTGSLSAADQSRVARFVWHLMLSFLAKMHSLAFTEPNKSGQPPHRFRIARPF